MHRYLLALFLIQIPGLVLPAGNGAWTVQVVTSGGFLGTGDGNFTISSEGKIACSSEMRCPKEFKPSDLQPLVEIIQSATRPVPRPPLMSFCHDCITRTITISRRDSSGMLHAYTASWDDTTRGNVPQEVLRIYDVVVALRQQ